MKKIGEISMDRLVQKDIFLIGIKMNWKDVWKEVVLKILKFNSMVELELAGLSVVPKNKKESPYTSISTLNCGLSISLLRHLYDII